jgi:hypothetical protein
MARKHDDQQQQQSLQQHVPQQPELPDHPSDPQPEASLLNMPVEVLELIATKLDSRGLKSMRATCRTLCNGSIKEFDQRHTSSEVAIIATNETTSMRQLTVTVRSPGLAKTQSTMTQLLALHDRFSVEDYSKGTIKASHTITSNPDAFTLLQVKNYRQWHGYKLTPWIFERVANLPSPATKLRRLVIEKAMLDGEALIKIFETHKHHLRCVVLRKVILTNVIGCVRALCRTETRRLELEELRIGERVGKKVSYLYFSGRHAAFPEFIEAMKNWEGL